MNRRDFIKYTSYGLASTSISTRFLQKKKLGVALVGLGYYSKGLLAPALQLTEHCYLAGIVTGSPEKIPDWQKKYGIKDSNIYNYENFESIADNDEIDVIYIVLPTGLHAEYAIKAANAGKHVWCEKPMAISASDCQKMIDTCNKNRVKLSIGYRMQHEPNTQTIIGYAKDKPYGDIQTLHAAAGYRDGGGQPWKLTKKLGGGAIYDMGVYPINGLRYASGENPIAVEAVHTSERKEMFSEVAETTTFTLYFPSGAIGHGKTTLAEGINKLEVECENGWYHLKPFQSYRGVRGRTSTGILLDKPIENQQAKQMDDDAMAIINNTSVLVPGEDGWADIHIIEHIHKAARSQSKVSISW